MAGKKVRKFNVKTDKYEDFYIPVEAAIYEDLDTRVRCAECGRELYFGDCYTSLVIHNPIGFGYGVCLQCYTLEREQERFRRWRDE